MKGIILAGGSGTRLYPITMGISKQLIPVFDKPMIYYPVSTLMLAGIKEILIISTPDDILLYERLFGDGSQLGLKFVYKVQPKPEGLAQAFIIGKDFIQDDDVCLILGDNVIYGATIEIIMQNALNSIKNLRKSVVFGYHVNDPERYGVVEFNNHNEVISIEEKPKNPKSNYAVIGLYFYTNDVIKISSQVIPSERGELEITSVNQSYLKKNKLLVNLLGDNVTWLDTGTLSSLYQAGKFIETVENRNGIKVGCIEEIAYEKGFISKDMFKKLVSKFSKNNYGKYLKKILEK